jgi:hypothetical protein
VSQVGGEERKKYSDYFTNKLILKYIGEQYKIVQPYKNSHESWIPLSRFLDGYQVPGMQIAQGEIPLSIF